MYKKSEQTVCRSAIPIQTNLLILLPQLCFLTSKTSLDIKLIQFTCICFFLLNEETNSILLIVM